MNNSTCKLAAAVFTLSTLSLAMVPQSAKAHGYMVVPQDYANSCKEGTTTDPTLCTETIGNQRNQIVQGEAAGNHKHVVPQNLCSANMGGEYSALDIPSSNRYATTLTPDTDGYIEISYMTTADHKTWYTDIFVTRDGFNPDTDALTWADLERVEAIDWHGKFMSGSDTIGTAGIKKYKVKWPEAKTGKRILYQVWQRTNPYHMEHEVLGKPVQNVWDSNEAFYSCANINIVSDGTPPDDSQWKSNEKFAPETPHLKIGDIVTARIMVDGTTRVEIDLDINANNIEQKVWKHELATKVNAHKPTEDLLEVGVLNSETDEVTLSANHELNRIFFTNEGFSHLIHVTQADQTEFEFTWNGLQDVYDKKPGESINIPLDLVITEGNDVSYTYIATLIETVQRNGQPVVIEGTVGDLQSFKIDKTGEYSVNVVIKDENEVTESRYFSFNVKESTNPEPGNTSVTWNNQSGVPVMVALQHGIWGEWVSAGATLNLSSDAELFNRPGWEVKEGDELNLGALVNGVEYVSCGKVTFSGDIMLNISKNSCSVN